MCDIWLPLQVLEGYAVITVTFPECLIFKYFLVYLCVPYICQTIIPDLDLFKKYEQQSHSPV